MRMFRYYVNIPRVFSTDTTHRKEKQSTCKGKKTTETL